MVDFWRYCELCKYATHAEMADLNESKYYSASYRKELYNRYIPLWESREQKKIQHSQRKLTAIGKSHN